ncbi:hypothetical protein CMUS01_10163 [Colletotrichum musicola]|uniref:ceramidase n=1 Tax=Colletotrichum musicola TaxID=2175873 RepID=A0A8H6N9Q6_9PEZI|nr:hypothetical protein CMUS01_10163 [Colletotrichum musicola]
MPSPKVPVYRIDLALPPERRYLQIARDFADQLKAIAPLFDLVLAQILVYRPIIYLTKFVVRLCLRSVCDPEETREIRSIAAAAGVDVHLIVALNTLLDCLLGCTSGAIPVRADDAPDAPARLMHFRTLDWGMPELTDLLVQLDFVDSESAQPDKVLARSITYAGFVGTLTGVRPGLSLSLNHRPLMNARTTKSISHQVLVVLGLRPSIASNLRQVLLAPTLPVASPERNPSNDALVSFAKSFSLRPSPTCYLIFSTPTEAVVIQKDHVGGNINRSYDFIAQANHDTDHTSCCGAAEFHHRALALGDASLIPPEQAWLGMSAERQDFVHDHWRAYCKRDEDHEPNVANGISDSPSSAGSCIVTAFARKTRQEKTTGVTREMLQKWITTEPVFNELTHFATIMDPSSGDVVCIEKRVV